MSAQSRVSELKRKGAEAEAADPELEPGSTGKFLLMSRFGKGWSPCSNLHEKVDYW